MKERIGRNAAEFRRPNGRWQVGRAARWFGELLGIPSECIVIMRPDGKPTKPTDTVGSLRLKTKAE